MTENTNGDPRTLQEIVELLSSLLKLLYPFPDHVESSNNAEESELETDTGTLNPDILTLADFKFRYQFTGLGSQAIMAIERTQRILRASKNFAEIGLCEFHIGLIYLDQNDCQGAIQQFQNAQIQWSYIDQTAAICLTHFAGGLAQTQRQAFEMALNQFQKVTACQKRIALAPYSDNLHKFGMQLEEELKKAQDEAREALWALTPPPTSDSEYEDEEDTAVPPPAAGDEEDGEDDRAVPPPPSTAEPTAEPTEESIETPQPEVLPPYMPETPSFQAESPVPEHPNTKQQLAWYQVHIQRKDPLFADIKDLGWLLVNQSGSNHQYKEGDLIIVASDDPNTEASVILKPQLPDDQVFHRICLARPQIDVDFTKNENEVQLSSEIRQVPVMSEHILGYVIGLWLEIGEFEILDS
jgi:tetratricopeptide (TPR) repeat protein